jgi:hypothetical protein
MWVFAMALSLVGWGETSQMVRAEVMRIREKDYIEGAVVTGLGDIHLLSRHVLPNLVPSLVVMAFLDMSGVLMLLSELGFVGVFIGGGWSTRTTQDIPVTYFDVPEWGVMLSHTWRTFRSQPWMTLYPALAFTVAIVGFNLFGEGLRRLTERLTLSMHRIVNRSTITVALVLAVLVVVTAEGTGSWAQFVGLADHVDGERALSDVHYLASAELDGRAIGSDGLTETEEYVAEQFALLGLQPASADEHGLLSYFSSRQLAFRSLVGSPHLRVADSAGRTLYEPVYRKDYVEVPDETVLVDIHRAEVMAVAFDQLAEDWPESVSIMPADLHSAAILVAGGVPRALRSVDLKGAVLVIAPDDGYLTHRQLTFKPALSSGFWLSRVAHVYTSTDLAGQMLENGGNTLSAFLERQRSLAEGDGFIWRTGTYIDLRMEVSDLETREARYVQALLPGYDEEMDDELVIVLASSDGLGPDHDGTPYFGANQNASGLAVMLEVVRALQQADYRPRRSMMFVAWPGAEQHATLDFVGMLKARVGFLESYRILAVLDLVGVGTGSAPVLHLQRGTSGRLTEVVQQAARRSGVDATTTGISMYGEYDYLYPLPDRNVPYVALSWEGSHLAARTPADTWETIEPEWLRDAGRVASLALMYLGHEKSY